MIFPRYMSLNGRCPCGACENAEYSEDTEVCEVCERDDRIFAEMADPEEQIPGDWHPVDDDALLNLDMEDILEVPYPLDGPYSC